MLDSSLYEGTVQYRKFWTIGQLRGSIRLMMQVSYALRWARIVTVLALLFAYLVPVRPVMAAEPETTPLDIVIAVDESGSLQPADVQEEIKAATAIATSGLNPRSRIDVIGFGSQNKPGQKAIDEVCDQTVADTQVRLDGLANCVRKLHRRQDGEGNDTDHLAALSKALDLLGSPGSPDKALKVVFLLTDGNLDVSRSEQYANDPSRRNDEANKRLKTQFTLATANRVQIWPLGFGNVNRPALDVFASGGSQESCDARPNSKPQARVVSSAQDVLRSLTEVYAAASCSGLSSTDSASLSPGTTTTLSVDIPVIATDGKITVSKGDPRVRVDYLDPSGHQVPANGKLGDTEVTRSGENSTIETLGLVNPVNGSWKVKLTAPPHLEKQLVSATAIWQGAVQASIVAEPPTARTGQPMTVRLSLLTRKGAITDERSLSTLNFAVVGEGPSGQQSIVVRDDGKAPDDKAHDGSYAGTFTAPSAPGDLKLTGVVTGDGIRAENIPVTVAVSAEAPPLLGRVTFDNPATLHPGATVNGTVTMENGGAPLNARVVLDGSSEAHATVSATDFTVPTGTTKHDFAITFGHDARLGGASLKVKVADVSDLTKVYANGQLTLTLTPKPTTWDKIRWYVVAAAIVLLMVLASLAELRRQRRRRVDVRGLVAVLNRDGDPICPSLRAPRRWSTEFAFVIRDDDSSQPRLDYPKSGQAVHRAKRGGNGLVRVRTSDGETFDIPIGGAGEQIASDDDGLSPWTLAFKDTRRSGPRPGVPARRPAPAFSPSAPPSAEPQTGAPDLGSDDEDDEWL